MPHLAASLDVAVPPEEAFRAFADLEAQARRAAQIAGVGDVRVRRHEADARKRRLEVDILGTTLRADVRFDLDEPRAFRYEAHGDWHESGTATFTPLDEARTRIDLRAEYETPKHKAVGKSMSLFGIDDRMAHALLERFRDDVEK